MVGKGGQKMGCRAYLQNLLATLSRFPWKPSLKWHPPQLTGLSILDAVPCLPTNLFISERRGSSHSPSLCPLPKANANTLTMLNMAFQTAPLLHPSYSHLFAPPWKGKPGTRYLNNSLKWTPGSFVTSFFPNNIPPTKTPGNYSRFLQTFLPCPAEGT